MKFKILILSLILIPSFASADSSFFSWITNLKVVPELRNKQKIIKEIKKEAVIEIASTSTPIATSTAYFSTTTTATTTFSQIKDKLVNASKNLVQDVNSEELLIQITKLKAENDALKRTVSGLQQKIITLTNENSSYIQNIEKIKLQSTPKVLARIKEIEWLIKGLLDNNYRNKIDAEGNKQGEMVVNMAFFRSTGADQFRSLIKEYDDLTGTSLALKFKEVVNTSSSLELKKFEEFYYYFLSIRKYPK